MANKKTYVTKSFLPPMEEYIEYLNRIWDSHQLTNFGSIHEEFRARLTELCESEYCFPAVNGHMALELGIQGFELEGEVITTPFTFASTTHAIVRNGLTPVFCDIREDDCTIDASKIEGLITDKTVAIVGVHVYGFPCDVYEIERIAKEHNLKVIYDGAHAFGEKLGGRSLMSFGDASMVSFHATKAFNTIEGGALVFHNPALAVKYLQLGNFGITGEGQVGHIGSNAKMNEFVAAMGMCNLNHWDEIKEARKYIYQKYTEAFKGLKGITLPYSRFDDWETNFTYFPIFVEDHAAVTRDQLSDILNANDIVPRKYFYPITCDYDCYKDGGYIADVPVARKKSEQVLTLPLYPGLEEETVDKIISIIIEAVEG